MKMKVPSDRFYLKMSVRFGLFPHESFQSVFDDLSASKIVQPVSCPHEGNMRYLHIPKLRVCFLCMKPLSLLRFQCNFCKGNRIEV